MIIHLFPNVPKWPCKVFPLLQKFNTSSWWSNLSSLSLGHYNACLCLCRCYRVIRWVHYTFTIRERGCFHCCCLRTITVVMTCGASDRSSFVRGVALRKLISEKIGIRSEKRCSSNHRAGSGCFLTLCFSEMQELWVCLFLYTIVQRWGAEVKKDGKAVK